MRPPFQRNPVWAERQKAFLIDTIIRGYPVPELYVQDVVDEKGNESHIVVDGQQRIRACLEFIEGGFALHGEDSPDYSDMLFDDLPPSVKKKVFEYKFVVRVLPDIPNEELRSIFGRLNRNTVALNRQELRHATYWGAFIKLMEKLPEDEFWQRSGVFSPNDVRRMLDVEFVSELAIGVLHGPQNKKASADRWYEVYEEEFEEEAELKGTFGTVCGELGKVLPEMSTTRWRKKSDCYSLFLAFAAHRDRLPLSRGEREQAGLLLKQLGTQVDLLITDETAMVPVDVRTYLGAVQRAASDLKNRKARHEVLERVLAPIWQADSDAPEETGDSS